MVIGEILQEASSLLAAHGLQNARLDAALLLACTLKTDRAGLIAGRRDTVASADLEKFRGLLERRLQGECIAYILGHKEFFALDFIVNRAVLVPRPETETLAEKALQILNSAGSLPGTSNKKPLRVLDLCTGSGAVAIALKHEMPRLEVWASDISAEALEVAVQNSKKILGGGQPVHFLKSDLFNNMEQSGEKIKFSLVVSNPPYIPSDKINALPPEVRNEPRLALDGGKDGLELIGRIIKEAPRHMDPHGVLILEADSGQMPDITALFRENNYCNIGIYRDLAGLDRVISAEITGPPFGINV